MTQKKDKELLLKDLCARLPYNVICQVEFKENGKYNSKVMLLSGIFTDEAYFTTKGGSIYSNEYKPYLFPLSSMTEGQEDEWYEVFIDPLSKKLDRHTRQEYLQFQADAQAFGIEYLLKNHFDYRGLIEKGLAIDATGLNIY